VENVIVQAADELWKPVSDLEVARESGKRKNDFDVFRMVHVGGLTFSLLPFGTSDPVTIVRDLMVQVHITTRKAKDGTVLASQTDVLIDSLPLTLNSQQVMWLMGIAEGMGGSFSRSSLEGPQFKVRLKLVEGKGLVPKDKNGLSDPFVKLRLKGSKVDGRPYQSIEMKSATKKKTLDPVWEEEVFEFTINHPENASVDFSVWDSNSFSKDRPMGHGTIDLKSFTADGPPVVVETVLQGVERGIIAFEVEVINWSKKVKPHPLQYLNVAINSFRFELVEKNQNQDVMMLGRKIKIEGVSGFAIEGKELLFGTIKPPVTEAAPLEEFSVQLKLQDLSIVSLDQDRNRNTCYILRAAPRNVQRSHTAQSTIDFLVCSLRRKLNSSFPVIREVGTFGDTYEANQVAPPSRRVAYAAPGASTAEILHSSAKLAEAVDDFQPPSLIKLRATQRNPLPKPPNMGPEVEAILNPLEITADVVLLGRLAGFLQKALGERPHVIPPQDIVEEHELQKKFEDDLRKAQSEKNERPPEEVVKQLDLPPVFRLNVELVCLFLVVPSPDWVREPGAPIVYLELNNVHLASHERLLSPCVDTLDLASVPGHVFPSEASDYSVSGKEFLSKGLSEVHNTGLKSIKLTAEWNTMTVHLRPSARTMASKLFNFYKLSVSLELQIDLILMALQQRLEPTRRIGPPVAVGGLLVEEVDGNLSQEQYRSILYIVNQLKVIDQSIGGQVDAPNDITAPADSSKEEDHPDVESRVQKMLNQSKDEIHEQLLKVDNVIRLIPFFVWMRIRNVCVCLMDVDDITGEVPEASVIARVDLNGIEMMGDNQYERSCFKLWFRQMNTFGTSAYDAGRLDRLFYTLESSSFPAFHAVRFVRKHGLVKASDFSDVMVLDRGLIVSRFGGMALKGHLFDVIPFLLQFFSDKLNVNIKDWAVTEHHDIATPQNNQNSAALVSSNSGPLNEVLSKSFMEYVKSLPSRLGQMIARPDYSREDDVTFQNLLCIESVVDRVEQVVSDARAQFEAARIRMHRNHQLERAVREENGLKLVQVPIAVDERRGVDRKEKIRDAKMVRMYEVYHEGWLTKRGTFFHTWKRRYHRLLADRIFYFRTPDSLAPLGVIHLEGAKISHVDYREYKRNYAFGITTAPPDNTLFVFQCDHEDDFRAWDQALQQYKLRAQRIVSEQAALVEAILAGDGNEDFTAADESTAIKSVAGVTEATFMSDASFTQPPVTDSEMDAIRTRLTEAEHLLRQAGKEKDALFARLPVIYQRAIDFRVSVLRQQTQELSKYVASLLLEQERMRSATTLALSRMEYLSNKARDAELEELRRVRQQLRQQRARYAEVRTKLSMTNYMASLSRGMNVLEWKKGAWKERTIKTVDDGKVLSLGWGKRVKNFKPDYLVPLGQIEALSFGTDATRDLPSAAIEPPSDTECIGVIWSVAASGAAGLTIGRGDSFSAPKSRNTVVFRAESKADAKVLLLAIQASVESSVKFSLSHHFTEGELLWSRCRYELMLRAMRLKKKPATVLAEWIIESAGGSSIDSSSLIPTSPGSQKQKSSSLATPSGSASAVWATLNVIVYDRTLANNLHVPVGSPPIPGNAGRSPAPRPLTVLVDARNFQTVDDIKARVRSELNIPVVAVPPVPTAPSSLPSPTSPSASSGTVFPMHRIVVRFTSPSGDTIQMVAETDVQEVLRSMTTTFDVFVDVVKGDTVVGM
jgi:hypothetical protein